jgi:hypothetical protein
MTLRKQKIIIQNKSPLYDALDNHRKEILSYLILGRAKWEKLINIVKDQELTGASDFANEQIWTFLIGCGYTLNDEAGIKELTRTLTGSDQAKPIQNKIWFECLPLPPRQGEGNTSIDLALGTISNRNRTRGGIELGDSEHTWICFCEMKCKSDISSGTIHDRQRNQLLRVIENALCFQNSGRYAEKVFVTLVTPAAFRYANLKSRLYQYQYEEYKNDYTRIIGDLRECSLMQRAQTNWYYPADITRRIEKLSLNWVTYEEILTHLPCPEEPLSSLILSKLRRFCSITSEQWPEM